MNRRLPGPGDGRGSAVPLVVVGLSIIGLLALAGIEAARFARSAARTQADAVAALHAADSGLDLYTAGAGPAAGPFSVVAEPGRADVVVLPLLQLPDSSLLVALRAEGRAPAGSSRPVIRRLGLLALLRPDGTRVRVSGSWRERLAP